MGNQTASRREPQSAPARARLGIGGFGMCRFGTGSFRIGSFAIGALAALLAACSSPSPPPGASDASVTGIADSVTGMRYLATGETRGFTRATRPRPFEFPQDHASHPDFRNEWWYFTGNAFDASGRHFGFELTFFRVGLGGGARAHASAWASNDLWVAHFALTDTANGDFHAEERLSRGALGLAGAEANPLRVWVEDWAVVGEPSGALRLTARGESAAIELEVRGIDRIVAQGDRGLDAKGPEPGNASYYYSAPRLAVGGTIRVGAEPLHHVMGSAWLDREWSTSALSAGVAGWDWFALQLDDGRDLMYYRLRQDDGRASPYSGGSVAQGDRVQRLDAEAVELEVTRRWRSRATGVEYPIGWRLRVPALALDLDIVPYLPGQELDLSVRYWEGAVRVEGSAGDATVAGNGYLELAGYR